MKSAYMLQSGRAREKGVAIIIVLAFVVLLSGLVVAFFSRSLSDQQVATSSVAHAKADILARSATDIIIGNLKEEIALGSNPKVIGQYYIPEDPWDAQPVRSGTNASIPNLVRRSMYEDTLPVSDKASNLPIFTSTASTLRQFSLERLNSHYLMPLSATTVRVSTPIAAAASVVPHWILLQGSTTGGVQPAVVSGPNDDAPDNIVGRYAYAIYDQGGLLDANVAGYPYTASTAQYPSQKDTLAYADLSVLPSGTNAVGTTAALTVGTAAINNLVAWRNEVSAEGDTPDSMNLDTYHAFVSSSNRHMMMVNRTVGANNVTDKVFTSRQHLIRHWFQSLYTTGSLVGQRMMPLQYLGTFSRDINQPSLRPEPNRPITSATGVDADNVVNPSFLSIRVENAFLRRDGSNAVIGEPLIKQRFALNRIANLQNLGNQTPYFGMVYNTLAGNWVYNNGDPNRILTLEEVADANREPDFFELLKAAITVGSLGQTAADAGSSSPYVADQYGRDRNTDEAIIQIGLNIIDQYDADGFPTHVVFNGRTFHGVENLPYLYRLRNGVVKVELPLVTGSSDLTAVAKTLTTPEMQAMKTGAAVMFLQPEVWNPHNRLSSRGTVFPSNFRLVVDSQGIGAGVVGETTVSVPDFASPLYSSAASIDSNAPVFFKGYSPVQVYLNANNTGISFSGGADNFWEPVPLIGANLSLSGAPSIILSNTNDVLISELDGSGYAKGSPGNSFVTSVQGPVMAAAAGDKDYVGIYLGVAPLAWVVEKSGTNYVVPTTRIVAQPTAGAGADYIVCRLQYERGGVWFDYDEKRVPSSIFGTQAVHLTGTNTQGILGQETFASAIDPRTSRFGMPGGKLSTTLAATYTTLTVTSTNAYTIPANGTGVPVISGPTVSGIPTGALWKNTTTNFYPGNLAKNLIDPTLPYYLDRDGVVRRAMAGYSSAATTLPETAGSVVRPIILNRPFRSVAELGYVFSGIPWRNLDMGTPESGFNGLLDVFCIDESPNENGLVAGKVNLNTYQPPVLRAILRGALTDELNNVAGTQIPIAAALTMGTGMSAYTSGTTSIGGSTGQNNMIANISEIVGRFADESAKGTVTAGTAAYMGLSTFLGDNIPTTPATARQIERLREAPIRALANVGNARTWNLLIDVFAQTGRYPKGAKASAFKVEGEQRYWVHVAIDRYTGEVIDQHIEVVHE